MAVTRSKSVPRDSGVETPASGMDRSSRSVSRARSRTPAVKESKKAASKGKTTWGRHSVCGGRAITSLVW